MIPKLFVNDGAAFPHFAAPFGIASGLVRAEFAAEVPTIASAGLEIAPNGNIESILQVHRRKMLRRAANRRSAQLSRARKKAHLEELKSENSRLQRLVDVLDSQPELVFCVTAAGRLTYISERTINFIKINSTSEDSDEDPTHLNQILTKESVDSVIETIAKLQKYTQTPTSDTDLNMLFAIKEVHFHDTFGHPVMGYLRCSKVHRRTSLHDLQNSDGIEKASHGGSSFNNSNSNNSAGPPAKKTKRNNGTASSSSGNISVIADKPQEPSSGWNLSNFKMLADYASAFTDEMREEEAKDTRTLNSNSNSSVTITDTNKSGEVSPSKSESEDEEYVCVIRTTDNCFIQYRFHSDLLLFSSVVPSSNGHGFDLRTSLGTGRNSRGGDSDSPSDSNGNAQSESSGQRKTGTSSETGSDDTSNIIEEEN